MKAIVGIEIEITRLEGKFKLSQNRPADALGVIEALAARSTRTVLNLGLMIQISFTPAKW